FGRAFGLGALVALVGIPAAFLVPGRSRAPQGAGAPASHGHRPEPVSEEVGGALSLEAEG
ncbi:MAG TPA: hypothetical protein VMU09_10845, partial [Acidimicrobiales bacterium]|nr:hypothetical protein [Acidimicrobiales bacterium]